MYECDPKHTTALVHDWTFYSAGLLGVPKVSNFRTGGRAFSSQPPLLRNVQFVSVRWTPCPLLVLLGLLSLRSCPSVSLLLSVEGHVAPRGRLHSSRDMTAKADRLSLCAGGGKSWTLVVCQQKSVVFSCVGCVVVSTLAAFITILTV